MPTNLPPEYFEVEERYREAKTVEEKIATLEELLSTIPKHKGTDKLRANFRRRLSKLKDASQTKKQISRWDSVFHVEREGAGQVAVIGCANVGKSSLLTKLTNATPEVGQAPFTTWTPTPGMAPVHDIQIQLIDTPPLNRDYVEPDLMDLIRRVDLILILVDLKTDPNRQLEDTVNTLEEHRIAPLHFKERFEVQRGYVFKPVLVAANKNDDEESDENFDIFCRFLQEEWNLLPISILTGRNLDILKEKLFEMLGIMRVYSKVPGEEADLKTPYVLNKGSTIEDFAGKVHQDFVENLKIARIWGEGVYDGQLVGRDHILHDGDIVELRI